MFHHLDHVKVENATRLFTKHFQRSRVIPAASLSTGGVDVFLKLESELPTGSFKIRGAVYALSEQMRHSNVRAAVAASTGNHGAAVAYAAALMKVQAIIFLPLGANPVKKERILNLGAQIREGGATLAEAADLAAAFAATTSAYLLQDATDPLIPIGTATIAKELCEQVPSVDRIYVPIGDTALIRGIAAFAKETRPNVRIVGVQSEQARAYYRAWCTGTAVTLTSADTIADGLATTRPVINNVTEIRTLVDEMMLVSDVELVAAIAWLLLKEHVVAEPAAAAPIAAFLKKRPSKPQTVALIVSGSNIEPDVLRAAVHVLQ